MRIKNIFCWILLLTGTILYAQEKNVRIQHFDEDDGFPQSYVQGMLQDSTGYVWIATWDGLYRYDSYRFQSFKARPGDNCPLKMNRITWIEESPAHDGIVCRSGEQFYLFDKNTQQFSIYNNKVEPRMYRAPKDVSGRIRELPQYRDIEHRIELIDHQKGVWVYSNRGLERITTVHTPIQTVKRSTASEEFVRGLYEDKAHHLWVADKNGYVTISSDQSSLRWLTQDGKLTATPSRFGSSIYTILEDSKGRFWLGSKPDGLFLLTPKGDGYSVSHFTHDENNRYSISSNNVYDIIEDRQHRILIATYDGGLNILDGERFIHAGNELKQYPKEAYVCRCLIETKDGTLLIGTDYGLYTANITTNYSETVFHANLRHPDKEWSLSNNYVMNMIETRQGDIFIATSGGGTDRIISRQLLNDTIHFTHYSTLNGLVSDQDMSLAEDGKGRIWIVSEASLSCLDATGAVTNYTKSFFEGGYAFSEVMPVLTSDGQLVFGTSQGILTFHPDKTTKSSFIPNIALNYADDVTLERGQGDFYIHFTTLDYNKNEDIVYAYRMEGVDSDWHYTKANELNYVGLKPGDYTLHLRSTNGDGVWVDNEHTIRIHRLATFNETIYAKLLYAILLMVLAICVFEIIRYIRKLQQEIKDVRLTSNEKIAILGERIKELLPITEDVKEIHEAEENLSNEDRLFAQKLKSYIETNIHNADLSVIDMANEMNVSRTVLYLRMKHIFDSTPNNYLLNTRINYAKTLLLEPGSRVSEVAFKSGFSDPKYFSRCFKKLTGKLPKDYK